jgi:hypothetical protein
MKFLLVHLLPLLLVGCVSANPNITKELAGAIPKGANTATLHTNLAADELGELIQTELMRRGLERQSDDSPRSFSTSFALAHQDTELRIMTSVAPGPESGSVATITGEWRLTAEFANFLHRKFGTPQEQKIFPAEWTRGRPAIAFGEVAEIAQEMLQAIPDIKVQFSRN